MKMKLLNLISVYTFFILALPTTSAKKHQISQGPSYVDSLLLGLQHEEWRDDEVLCKKATLELLYGVKNHSTWATWIWDSMQLPVAVLYGSRYILGSYDQCLADPWSVQPSQYCLVDVQLTADNKDYEEVDPRSAVEEFVKIKTEHGRRRVNIYTQGVCLPAVCSPSSVAKISQHIHQLSHLPFGNVSVDPSNCQVKETQIEFSTGFYVFWIIIITTTSIATTAYIKEDSIKNPKLIKLFKWFSPSKNFQNLSKTSKDEVLSLNGVRAFCAGATVVMHYYYFFIPFMANHIDLGKQIASNAGAFFIQFALFIEGFFLLSGILLMKGLLTSRSDLMTQLWKRYIKLTAPMALILLYISAVLPHTISGPLRPKLMVEQVELCMKSQWNSLLMFSNFVGKEEICPFFNWHLSCDLQLTIFGTLLFWVCQRRRPVMLLSLLFLLSLVVPAVWTYWEELPPILAYDLETAIDYTKNIIFQSHYIKPYSRASSYFIGLALGYIMHIRKPQDYRNTISKTWSILGGVLGIFMMLAVMGVGGVLNIKKYNSIYVVAYAVFEKSIMALGLSLLIVVIEYGTLPLIGDFLNMRALIPLSRLSFGLCLYHSVLLWQNVYTLRTSLTFNFLHLLVNGFGYIVISFVISYLMWFIVEAPVINITNSLFSRADKSTQSPEQKSKENGIAVNYTNGISKKKI